MYEVILHPAAQKTYTTVDSATAKKLARCFIHLEQTPRTHPNIKPLKGNFAGLYRFRIGNYRVFYSIDDKSKQVLVLTIKHRSEAYE